MSKEPIAFVFWGGAVVFPLIPLRTVISYRVFRGNGKSAAKQYWPR
jgi:hypothetical protein